LWVICGAFMVPAPCPVHLRSYRPARGKQGGREEQRVTCRGTRVPTACPVHLRSLPNLCADKGERRTPGGEMRSSFGIQFSGVLHAFEGRKLDIVEFAFNLLHLA
jgi:hypothetical protein